MNKIISYIGFAIKSKNIIMGQTALKHNTKPVYLIMCCNSSSQNLKDLATNLKNKFNCPLIFTTPTLESLSNTKNLKILGITDENLAKAIFKNKEIIIG